MIKEDFNLKNINKTIREFIEMDDGNKQDENRKLNYCRMIVQSYKEDLSVIGKYEKPEQFYRLNSDLKAEMVLQGDSDTYYYGISPCIDSKKIVGCISNLNFKTIKDIKDYIRANKQFFMVQENQKESLVYLAEYILVVMASHFGIKIEMGKETYEKLKGYLKNETSNEVYTEKVLKEIFKYDKGFLTIYGCPTAEVLSFLRKYRYVKKNAGEKICRLEKNKKSIGSLRIEEIYRDSVELVKGRVFYSGVLLKPVSIDVVDSLHENDQIQSVCISFVRSTYGTVCALDANLTDHPVLNDDKAEIIAMLRKDDEYKKELHENLDKILGLNDNCQCTGSEKNNNVQLTKDIFEKLNEYLGKSFNVNQIGVSANIVTSDGFVLLGQRNVSSIDEGKLYPGVNGNAEVADKDVTFYSTSVYEDYPTIRLNDDRIDFFGEIGRETYGELQQDLSKQEWICYGIIISGNMPGLSDESTYSESFRRLHFNLIFEHPCKKTFEEIEKSSIKAAEAFETKDLIGVNVRCEKSKKEYRKKYVYELLTEVINHKDFIESLVTLIVLILAASKLKALELDFIKSLLKTFEWQEYVSLFLALIIVLVTVYRFVKKYSCYDHKAKRTKRIIIYEDSKYCSIGEHIYDNFKNKVLNKKIYDFHPAAYVSLLTYIENKTFDTFYPTDRR